MNYEKQQAFNNALIEKMSIRTSNACEYYFENKLTVRKAIRASIDNGIIKDALIEYIKNGCTHAHKIADALMTANKDFHFFNRKKHLKFYNSLCAISRMEISAGSKEFHNSLDMKDGKFVLKQEILDLF